MKSTEEKISQRHPEIKLVCKISFLFLQTASSVQVHYYSKFKIKTMKPRKREPNLSRRVCPGNVVVKVWVICGAADLKFLSHQFDVLVSLEVNVRGKTQPWKRMNISQLFFMC